MLQRIFIKIAIYLRYEYLFILLILNLFVILFLMYFARHIFAVESVFLLLTFALLFTLFIAWTWQYFLKSKIVLLDDIRQLERKVLYITRRVIKHSENSYEVVAYNAKTNFLFRIVLPQKPPCRFNVVIRNAEFHIAPYLHIIRGGFYEKVKPSVHKIYNEPFPPSSA